LHDFEEHVFKVSAADFEVFQPHTGRAQACQQLLDLGRVVRLDLRDAAGDAGVDVELRQTLWQFIARLNKEGHTVLLTTHYLEEAEALCGRIAMLKQGRVVALDRTSNLLAGASSTMLRFKTDDALPAAIAAHARVTGRIAQVKARDAADVEQTLATLRTAGVRIEDLEIGRADLEDVFLDIMQGGRA
jgi:ABC-2 type transport system ATP-binding protein